MSIQYVCESESDADRNWFDSFIKQISGIRFQNIVNLNNKKVIAKEVLTSVSGDPELFFSILPPEVNLSIFLWQVEILKTIPGKHWLNLPVAVFCEPYLINQLLLSGPADESIAIEIQDPENIERLDNISYHRLKSGVNRLKSHGWCVILDDLSAKVNPTLSARDFQFPIVKLDRYEIRHNPDIHNLVKSARRLGRYIVMEGIENLDDLELAKSTGADAGQGFLWPQEYLDYKVPETVSRTAWKWHQELNAISRRRLKVYIESSDNFFISGINSLLCSLDSANPLGLLWQTSGYDSADFCIVTIDASTGHHSCGLREPHSDGSHSQFVFSLSNNDIPPVSGVLGNNMILSKKLTLDKLWFLLRTALFSARLNPVRPRIYSNLNCTACRINTLSPKEREIMQFTGTGYTIDMIASLLSCSSKTVSNSRRRAMKKLGLKCVQEFIRLSRSINKSVKGAL